MIISWKSTQREICIWVDKKLKKRQSIVWKFLVIVLGVGWLLGQLIRYFLRSKLAKFARHVNDIAKEEQRAQRHASSSSDEIIVDYIPKKQQEKGQKDIRGGEYVDYEEVKE